MMTKRNCCCKVMKIFFLQILTKGSLAGLVSLLLYLTWSPQQRKILIEKTGLDDYRQTTPQLTVNMEVFNLRQQALEQYCVGANLTAIHPPQTMIYSRRLHLAYCPLYMAASTPIKYALTLAEGKRIYSHKLYNISLRQAIHSDTQKIALRHPPERLNGRSDILLVVRDPWQRLVSAYRKLIESAINGASFHTVNCKKILNNNGDITFELFIQCIIKSVDTGVKLSTNLQPIYTTCALCKIKYTNIVRFENIWPELTSMFISSSAKTQYEGFLKDFSTCPVRGSAHYDLTPYLKSLSSYSKERIQEIYRPDFVIFGYTFLEDLDGI